jgi:lambda family phage minor tail protein L
MAENKLNIELHKLSPSAVVSLYILEIPECGEYPAQTLYFHTGLNLKQSIEIVGNYSGSIVWKGQPYAYIPIEITGFELTSQGTLPTPTARIGNVTGAISSITQVYEDLVGAKVTRQRVYVRFLDAVNFPNDYNPDATTSLAFPDEVYSVEQKTNENSLYVEFKLSSVLDLDRVKLPRRRIQCTTCTAQYRSVDCMYSGGYDVDGSIQEHEDDPIYALGIPVMHQYFSWKWSATRNYDPTKEPPDWKHPVHWIAFEETSSGSDVWVPYRAKVVILANAANPPPSQDPIHWARDYCQHTLKDCKKHFGWWKLLPFNAFPGASKLPN